jgi:hypothetical protein
VADEGCPGAFRLSAQGPLSMCCMKCTAHFPHAAFLNLCVTTRLMYLDLVKHHCGRETAADGRFRCTGCWADPEIELRFLDRPVLWRLPHRQLALDKTTVLILYLLST